MMNSVFYSQKTNPFQNSNFEIVQTYNFTDVMIKYKQDRETVSVVYVQIFKQFHNYIYQCY